MSKLLVPVQGAFRFTRIIAASPGASWFETREGALLTMRVWYETSSEEHCEAMRLEG
jgi:hypothetical protein